MEVKIICEELIKPSSPTPHHLKTHKLSLLDHLAPNAYVPVLLFYPNHQLIPSNQKSQPLEQSLSETLTRFYPFAGKIRDSVSIECDDIGVHYATAKANCHLSEYLDQPDLRLMHKFLPAGPTWDLIGERVTKIQVTVFACDGIVIGSYFYHQLVDGTALSSFLKDWAATARKCQLPSPRFDASALFPLNEPYPKDATWSALLSPFCKKGRFVTGRFVFDGPAISKLKARANESAPAGGSNSTILSPTRVEAVTALLWKCIAGVFRERSGIRRPSLVTHQVNIRQRAEPKYSDQYVGNFQWTAATNCVDDTGLCGLVCELREALKKIGNDLVKRLQGDGGFTNTRDLIMEMKREFSGLDGGTDYIRFSSWCRFGLYEVDFGWGKPSWATWASFIDSESILVLPRFIILMDARSGDGIEALVTMEQDDMAILENDKELLEFASNNPSLLEIGCSVSHS